MLWILAMAVSTICILGGLLSARKHRVLGRILFGLSILAFIAPLAAMQIVVDLPPMMHP